MQKSKSRPVLYIILVIVLIGVAVVYFMWNKPRRNVNSEKGIEITSAQLVKEYQQSETAANTKYLDKAIQVTGPVVDVSNNQEGKVTVTLSSDDPMTSVFCTLKENAGTVAKGSSVTIKGFCSGMLSDVRLREAEIVK